MFKFLTFSLDGLVSMTWEVLKGLRWHACDVVVVSAAIWMLLRWTRTSGQRVLTTELRGPPSESFLFGVGKQILDSKDSGAVYEAWAQEYGSVYAVPSTLGSKRIILCDPKAIAHYYSKESWTYVQTPFTKKAIARLFGRGLSWAHGDDHRRQRRFLSPAFSVAATRQLTPVFYDSAYKAKIGWDALIESGGGDSAVIEVQSWMNHISLDSIGLAGFSHNFGTLEGMHAYVAEVFDSFGTSSRRSALDSGLFLLGLIFPFLSRIPTARIRKMHHLNVALEDISKELLARTQKEMELGVYRDKEEKSIIGLLINGTNGNSAESRLTQEEVVGLMKQLILAGYETTSISLTWALLELSRNLDVQTRLRNELLEHGTDPTYDQLANGCPYLDAVTQEVLRIHPPIVEFTRIAIEDDVIPLSDPVRTKSGELVDTVTIAKDTLVAISMESMNRSVAIWGEDAKVFRPSRWLEDVNGQDGIPDKAKEIQGHRHLLTFVDGPRMCLGKHFALAEFKAVLTILVKNFVLEPRDGIDSKIETGRGVLPRPKVAGEVGCKVPLRVRPYVA